MDDILLLRAANRKEKARGGIVGTRCNLGLSAKTMQQYYDGFDFSHIFPCLDKRDRDWKCLYGSIKGEADDE